MHTHNIGFGSPTIVKIIVIYLKMLSGIMLHLGLNNAVSEQKDQEKPGFISHNTLLWPSVYERMFSSEKKQLKKWHLEKGLRWILLHIHTLVISFPQQMTRWIVCTWLNIFFKKIRIYLYLLQKYLMLFMLITVAYFSFSFMLFLKKVCVYTYV